MIQDSDEEEAANGSIPQAPVQQTQTALVPRRTQQGASGRRNSLGVRTPAAVEERKGGSVANASSGAAAARVQAEVRGNQQHASLPSTAAANVPFAAAPQPAMQLAAPPAPGVSALAALFPPEVLAAVAQRAEAAVV